MRVDFTKKQLGQPRMKDMESILRSCVHCGLCTSHCPSYVELGDELDNPRGRIGLVQDALEKSHINPTLVKHMDRCLSCNACMSVCPSGVDYMHLSDFIRIKIEDSKIRPFHQRFFRFLLYRATRHPFLLRSMLFFGFIGKAFAFLMPKNIKAAIAFAPKDLRMLRHHPINDEIIHPARGPTRIHAILFNGCAQKILAPEIDEATIKFLTRLGAEISVVNASHCCGSMALHLGKEAQARDFMAGNIEQLPENADYVIANASGCGLMMKNYGYLDPDNPKARHFAEITRDVSEIIDILGMQATKKPQNNQMTIAWHNACALQHGQKIDELPLSLLKQAGFRVVVLDSPHSCCGWGGSYHIFQSDLSKQIRDAKIATIQQSGADMVVSNNMGCLLHLAPALSVPCLHYIQLLDWASGGDEPKPFI